MSDFEEAHFHEPDIQRLVSGVANNAPHLLPTLDVSANRKRRALAEQRVTLEPGTFLEDAPVAGIPDPVHPHMDLFARKLLAAMYYRETARVLGPGEAVIVRWAQLGTPAAIYTRELAVNWFGDQIMGRRGNEDIGNQFSYRHGYHPAHGFFGLWMEFGKSVGFLCIAGPKERLEQLQGDWVQPFVPLDELARRIKKSGE